MRLKNLLFIISLVISYTLYIDFYYKLAAVRLFCLCLSHAAWAAQFNSSILLVSWRQHRPRTMGISRLEVSCRITVCVCVCVCVYAQSHPTLCNAMDCSPPVSSVHGILQAKVLEWVAISCSKGSSQPRDKTHVSCIADRFFTAVPPGKPYK